MHVFSLFAKTISMKYSYIFPEGNKMLGLQKNKGSVGIAVTLFLIHNLINALNYLFLSCGCCN